MIPTCDLEALGIGRRQELSLGWDEARRGRHAGAKAQNVVQQLIRRLKKQKP